MENVAMQPVKIIGLKIRTSNDSGKADIDIPALWNKFMGKSIAERIPNRIDDEIVAVYTNYESDYTKPYDMIIGCRVGMLDTIPEGMVGRSFDAGNFTKFTAKGDLTKDAVINTWMQIWKTPLERSYLADFEVYGEKAQNPYDGEAEIFVGVK
ncbi:hypothetical protein NBRC110019_13090 [Neptunitalea chrysea]|uniref:AraC effector-binding domain-containing protein n=1 Tax=Neptunitalea chrysea TaxID=1647581 RepID=A0A9W6B4C2_9FLAO|nr:effector binding domain-containing protein [Neptunitalea chrysea]GLB52270.1 hypothetical protein NBRC110019_13090 [Neptunitalea chrysea]